jgi:hypothetical protein
MPRIAARPPRFRAIHSSIPATGISRHSISPRRTLRRARQAERSSSRISTSPRPSCSTLSSSKRAGGSPTSLGGGTARRKPCAGCSLNSDSARQLQQSLPTRPSSLSRRAARDAGIGCAHQRQALLDGAQARLLQMLVGTAADSEPAVIGQIEQPARSLAACRRFLGKDHLVAKQGKGGRRARQKSGTGSARDG